MSMKPLEFDRRYGELDQVIGAYVGESADDDPDRPSRALQAYLRHTWHTRPWALSQAERQIREYARNPPGRLRLRIGEFYPVPDVGLPDSEIQGWFVVIADHIKRSVEEGEVPSPSVMPQTHWEWQARFPEVAQLFGGWFSQDMPDEFVDHEAGLRDYATTVDRVLVARAVGELRELLALGFDESDHALALAELGMEVDPPVSYTPGEWLAMVADRLGGFRAEYGPPGDEG
ncbi:contact-dependent growth inhibition system immunity protein [Streptomyces niveus]|uniref:contact-dependent growth inhibition system immunity protein n=1 Tax=Streptomyces niveus TaxID=193462 RepID=UPI00344C1B44